MEIAGIKYEHVLARPVENTGRVLDYCAGGDGNGGGDAGAGEGGKGRVWECAERVWNKVGFGCRVVGLG